jgi:hypothetical protein
MMKQEYIVPKLTIIGTAADITTLVKKGGQGDSYTSTNPNAIGAIVSGPFPP